MYVTVKVISAFSNSGSICSPKSNGPVTDMPVSVTCISEVSPPTVTVNFAPSCSYTPSEVMPPLTDVHFPPAENVIAVPLSIMLKFASSIFSISSKLSSLQFNFTESKTYVKPSTLGSSFSTGGSPFL